MDGPEPAISVVIPTHNRTGLLAETIRSVLGQTYPPREVIVVDNGTEGRARHVVAPFGSRVTLIGSSPNAKQIARNTGIEAASSPWIATLDDDDLWESDYLATAAVAMRDGRADIIGVDHRKFSSEGEQPKTNFELAPAGYWDGIAQPIGHQGWSFVGRFPRDRLLRRVPFYPSSTVFRRSLAIRLGGYDPAMKGIMAEDLEFLIRLMGAGDVALIWRPLMRYRLHPGNDTASKIGQEFGRWRIFEFARSSHRDLDIAFRQALDEDLPRRRRRIFDLAYRVGDRATLAEAFAKLSPADLTLKRRLQSAMPWLSPRVADIGRKAIGRVAG